MPLFLFSGSSGGSPAASGVTRIDLADAVELESGDPYQLALSTTDLESPTIELFGTPADSRIFVTFPDDASLYGRAWVVRNASDDRTSWVKIVDESSDGLWLPPGTSRLVAMGEDGIVRAADGKGASFECHFEVEGTDEVGMTATYLFLLPAGWMISTLVEYVKSPPVGEASATTVVGVASGPILDNASPVPPPAVRGLVSGDWGTQYEDGYFLDTSDQQVGVGVTLVSGDLTGVVLAYTIAGRRVI